VAEGAKRAGTVPEAEADGIPEESAGAIIPEIGGRRQIQAGGLDLLQDREDASDLIVGTPEGPKDQAIGFRLGEDHPLPPSRADKGTDGERHAPPPKTEGYFFRSGTQSASWQNRRTI